MWTINDFPAYGMCLSVYFKDRGNYSLLNDTIHGVYYIRVYQRNVYVGIFYKP